MVFSMNLLNRWYLASRIGMVEHSSCSHILGVGSVPFHSCTRYYALTLTLVLLYGVCIDNYEVTYSR